ncbi:hypothetical protein GCM10009117_10460 [Gangjinia marincola]|uniref:DUF4199 domain-containing protein n=1 Tax=Gangjinia marincola TaxID=578463 RepID=A0ABN1MFI0_9FLAO
MEANIKKIGVNQGLTLGLILATITILVYAVAQNLATEWYINLSVFILVVIFGIVASVKSRKAVGGFISFKDAFIPFFITVVIGIAINTVISIIIYNFIDPDAAQAIQEQIMISTREMMEKFGAPQQSIDEAMAQMADQNSFSIGAQLQGLAMTIVFLSIIGLIVAAIIKRKDPAEA